MKIDVSFQNTVKDIELVIEDSPKTMITGFGEVYYVSIPPYYIDFIPDMVDGKIDYTKMYDLNETEQHLSAIHKSGRQIIVRCGEFYAYMRYARENSFGFYGYDFDGRTIELIPQENGKYKVEFIMN